MAAGAALRLAGAPVDAAVLPAKLRAMRTLGVPYSDADIQGAAEAATGKTELDALVAYLQVLGTMVDFTTYRPDATAASAQPAKSASASQ